uniref:Peptidase S1 domain-containing protein n=1 Tax=Anopheles melas TaxID=34690 RepID=A0A182U9W6_9DIPT
MDVGRKQTGRQQTNAALVQRLVQHYKQLSRQKFMCRQELLSEPATQIMVLSSPPVPVKRDDPLDLPDPDPDPLDPCYSPLLLTFNRSVQRKKISDTLISPVNIATTSGDAAGSLEAEAKRERTRRKMVLLGSTRPDGTREFRCGGSYIGQNIVLAGAHCVTGKNQPALDTVRFGSGTDNVMHFRIVNNTLHYRYKPQFEYHNMAVYYLDARPDLVNAGRFKPACILKPHMKQGIVQMVGDSSNGRGLALQSTLLDVVASEKCHEYYNPIPKLRFGVLLCCFCAMNSDTTECSNMHSSPLQLVINRNGKSVPFLIGHKSIGKACGVKSPAVFTRYGSYYEWLETITDLPLEATGN